MVFLARFQIESDNIWFATLVVRKNRDYDALPASGVRYTHPNFETGFLLLGIRTGKEKALQPSEDDLAVGVACDAETGQSRVVHSSELRAVHSSSFEQVCVLGEPDLGLQPFNRIARTPRVDSRCTLRRLGLC